MLLVARAVVVVLPFFTALSWGNIRTSDIDVCAQACAEAALNDQFRELFGAASDHIALLSENGTILKVNTAWGVFAEQNGYPDPNVGLGENYLEVCERAARIDPLLVGTCVGIRKVLAGDLPSFETIYPCHSPQKRRWFRMESFRLQTPGAARLAIRHVDITNVVEKYERQVEETFSVAGRLGNVAALSGLVGHDANNYLTIVMGNTELMMNGVGKAENLSQISQAASKLAEALRVFNSFRRLSVSDALQSMDLAQFVTEANSLFGTLLRSYPLSIKTSSVSPVRANKYYLSQILITLWMYFRNAIVEPAELSVGLEDRFIKDGEVPRLRAGTYVRWTFSARLSPSFRDDRFLGAFTALSNAGLPSELEGGLPAMNTIVHFLEGAVSVRSTGSNEIEFEILLPAVPRESASTQRSSKRILLVEDEGAVAQFASLMLVRQGYTVEIASNYQEAVGLAERNRFDLAIVDWRIPGGTGLQLIEALTERACAFPNVILTSGLPILLSESDRIRLRVRQTLQKPWSSPELVLAVGSVL